jgi:hypothetical protein
MYLVKPSLVVCSRSVGVMRYMPCNGSDSGRSSCIKAFTMLCLENSLQTSLLAESFVHASIVG